MPLIKLRLHVTAPLRDPLLQVLVPGRISDHLEELFQVIGPSGPFPGSLLRPGYGIGYIKSQGFDLFLNGVKEAGER
jgi:hypothetical protein